MVRKRDIPLYVVLTIITCGVFGLYCIYGLGKDIKRLNRDSEPSHPLLYVLVSVLTCGIFLIYIYYQYPKYIVDIQEQRQLKKVDDISVITLILGLSPIVVGFLLAPVVFLINMGLIQDQLNKLAKSES